MKNDFLLPYPTLTDELISDLRIVDNMGGIQSSFRSLIGGEFKHLILQQVGDHLYSPDDDDQKWHPQVNNLILDYDFEIINPWVFFDEKYAIASDFSTLGLAIRWKNKDARVRGAFALNGDDITLDCTKCHFHGSYEFQEKMFRGDVDLELIIYLKSCGSVFHVQNQYCKVIGSCLGIVCTNTLHIAGGGNVFPIIDIQDDTEGLWGIYISPNIEYENEELDEESLYLWVNSSHPDYYKFGLNNYFGSTFFKEILASFFYNLIITVYNDMGDDLFKNKPLMKTSIAQYVRILISTKFDIKQDLQNLDYVAIYTKIREVVLSVGVKNG